MSATYEYEPIELIIFLIGVTTLVVALLRHRDENSSFKQAAYLMTIGILLLLISTLCTGFISGRWDLSYMLTFLSLKVVDGWFPRGFAIFGYFFFISGCTVLFNALVKLKK